MKTCNRRDTAREIRHLMYGENARTAVGTIYRGMEIYGLSKGQFSIINIIEEILRQTGPADVVISTWTAANAEIKKAEMFLDNNMINRLNFIVDRSFKTRQPIYYKMLTDRFGDIVSTTDSHAKFIMIGNKDWKITIRTSMNLNENKRLENFEISDDPNLYSYLGEISKDIIGKDYSYQNFLQLGLDDKYKPFIPNSDDPFFRLSSILTV